MGTWHRAEFTKYVVGAEILKHISALQGFEPQTSSLLQIADLYYL